MTTWRSPGASTIEDALLGNGLFEDGSSGLLCLLFEWFFHSNVARHAVERLNTLKNDRKIRTSWCKPIREFNRETKRAGI